MNDFYLIRHALTDWMQNEHRPLSKKGMENAMRIAEVLESLPITAIFSSAYQRAQETVATLSARLSLSVVIEPDLWERTLGDTLGVNDFFTAVRNTWQNPAFCFPGGETNAAAQQRGVAFVQRLWEQHTEGHLVLSTHGNLIALILQHFDPSINFTFWIAMTMPDIYMLDLSQIDTPAIIRLWKE